MVADGLARSRAEAQALILANQVLVDDVPVDKAGAGVRDTAAIRLRAGARKPYVSRGGEKLAGALEDLAASGLAVKGLRCLDVGASTGGFTDCLLQAGAREVVAVDVGYGQLHPRLREDPRVLVRERTNARELCAEQLGGSVDLTVADASFISLRLLLPALARATGHAPLLLLVKPQFEVGRARVGKGGVVRDDALRAEAAAGVAEAAAAEGYAVLAQVDSRLPGPKGNREIFLWLRVPGADAENSPEA
jgi:23S rRNA (cytidine1920-2'-O)/16S rRNA (cytidine1409-2'-O)-methyltransferase